jgi:hypothetical protein
MKAQEAAAQEASWRQRCAAAEQRAARQADEAGDERRRADRAEARAQEAAQEAAALRGEVERRRSVHCDSISSVERMQARSCLGWGVGLADGAARTAQCGGVGEPPCEAPKPNDGWQS